ncbi:inositol phospholipid synthesis and fat-storage-inducing TM-domain-containing protein [Lipomyces doorenjongii]|uniref:inositol phospholipid synthesis and fat-storage-inducing TM-domain-containing protein n=1 Tax=Lipomyces doorenjongii TaxID=383834 RepID=UPI0034CD0214
MQQNASSTTQQKSADPSTVLQAQSIITDITSSNLEPTEPIEPTITSEATELTSDSTPGENNSIVTQNSLGLDSPLLPALIQPPTPPLTPPPAYPRKYVAGLFTFEQLSIFLIYPSTIAVGSLISIVSPPESYFGSRTNFFNVFFVKNGWFWTTITFMVHCIRLRISKPSKLAIRYVFATSWWFLFTQWFFGAPIMDRVFVGTGGVCFVDDPEAVPGQERQVHDSWSSFGCRHVKGEWAGGHDISGHSFLLTHASLFLWFELLPVVMERGPLLRQINTKIVFVTLALWWWMLLMTGIYFHTFTEKVTGWLCGIAEWAIIYILLPGNRTLTTMVGVPAV